jgi:hypothetical protein
MTDDQSQALAELMKKEEVIQLLKLLTKKRDSPNQARIPVSAELVSENSRS